MKKLRQSVSMLTLVSLIGGFCTIPSTAGASNISEGDIMTMVDMSDMYNTNGIYTSIKNQQGNAGYPGAFYYDDFISDEKHEWKNKWTEGMTDNILLFNNVEFNMRVIDHKAFNNKTPCVFWNSNNSVYENIDIEDGFFKSVEILVNSEKQTNRYPKKLGIKINYAGDYEEVYEYDLNYFADNGTNVFESTATDTSWTQGKELTQTGKISHISIDTNITKEVKSIDILNDKYDFQTNADGSYKTDAEGKYMTKLSTEKNRARYLHSACIYAITLVQNEELIEKAKEEKVRNLYEGVFDKIEKLGEIDNLKTEQIEDINEIADMMEEIEDMGYPINSDKISNYDKYLQAVIKIKEIQTEEALKYIVDLITELGEIDELTLDDEVKLDNISEKINEAAASGIEINETTVKNYSTYLAAVEAIKQIKIKNRITEIEEKITALGDIEALTSDDSEKVEEITKMIENAKADGIEISANTVSNYNDYIAAQRQIKANTPIVVPVDLSSYYNCGNIYTSTRGYNGSAGYAGSFYYPSVTESLDWKYEWGEDTIDNILNIGDKQFKLRVLDRDINTGSCIFKNSNANEIYTKIDFEDGNYNYIYILGNSDVQTSPAYKKFGFKVNYSDGTHDVYDIDQTFVTNRPPNLGFQALNSNMGNYYTSLHSIKTDYSKEVTDIEVLNEKYDFVLDDDGNITFDDENEPIVEEYTDGTSRYTRHHSTAIYAISLEMPYGDYLKRAQTVLDSYEDMLSDKIETNGGSITKMTEAGRNIYNSMNEYFEILNDDEYESKFKNYNMIKTAVPHVIGGEFNVNNDIITAEIEFDKQMIDLDGKIRVKFGNENIDDFIVKHDGNKAVVTFNNRFNDDTKYKVVASSDCASYFGSDFTLGSAQSYSFTTNDSIMLSEFSFVDDKGKEIESVEAYKGSKINITCKLSNKGKNSREYFILLCMYDENDNLISVQNRAGTVASGTSSTVSAEFEKNNAKYFKAIFMNGSKSMKTVCTTVKK